MHKIYRSDDDNDYLLLLAEGRLVNLGNATGQFEPIMDGLCQPVLPQLHLFEQKFADMSLEQQKEYFRVEVLPAHLDEESHVIWCKALVVSSPV